jgi:hypothetical protein
VISFQEILNELPKLTRAEREEILERIIQLDCERTSEEESDFL